VTTASAGGEATTAVQQPAGPTVLGPMQSLLAAGPGKVAHWAVLPDRKRPRLLIPLQDRRAAAAAVRDYARHSRRLGRLQAAAFAAALRTGVPLAISSGRRVEVDAHAAAELVDLLSGLVGQPVVAAVHIGSERPNSKPVLYLLAPDGPLLGIAKLATTPLSRALLETEFLALEVLSRNPPAELEVPRPLCRDEWRDIPLYLQAPLPLRDARHAPPAAAIVPAVAALSRIGRRHERLAATPWWRQVYADTLAPGLGRVRQLIRLVEHVHGERELGFGAAHGDLAPWNAARRNGHLLLWDWERFVPAAPVGMDLLHYTLWDRVGPAGPTEAVRAMLAAAPALLAGCRVVDPRQQHATVAAYAVTMAARYLGEGGQPSPQRRAVAEALVAEVGVSMERSSGAEPGR
jgi:hypothetical protein